MFLLNTESVGQCSSDPLHVVQQFVHMLNTQSRAGQINVPRVTPVIQRKKKKKASGCSIGSAAAPSYCSLWVNAGTKTQTVHVLKRCTSGEALVLFTTALAFLQWAVYCQNLQYPNYLDTVDKRWVESTSNRGFFHTVFANFTGKFLQNIHN